MFKTMKCAAIVLALCTAGCVSSQGIVPIGNHSNTDLKGNNFKVARTGLRGEASCLYVLGLFPTGDPAVATRAMDQLIESAGGSGKSVGLINFSGDTVHSNYLFVTISTVTMRADAVEFSDVAK